MTDQWLSGLIFAAGIAHLGVLAAAAFVPFLLRWRDELRSLSRLHRQMHWVYAGYIFLSITAFAIISVLHAGELAGGGGLARAFCLYVCVFWGVRLGLQAVFDVKELVTVWWVRLGYHGLTVLFACLTAVYAWAAFRPGR